MEHNAHHALKLTSDEKKDERLVLKKEMQFIREVDVNFIKPEIVEVKNRAALRHKTQFLYKLQKFKHQGKVNSLMDRVGNWIKRNSEIFSHDGHGHDYHEDLDALKQKTLDKFWVEAEKMI